MSMMTSPELVNLLAQHVCCLRHGGIDVFSFSAERVREHWRDYAHTLLVDLASSISDERKAKLESKFDNVCCFPDDQRVS